eukprot:TRINITY_DN1571_c3_g1_i1.p2 TRINITY_DN1571_c3_g1~~TRINITY_DN1571_c3_g1_i1.p2  ORF type:complete len:399 (+),score=104.20 TRINITY_DN1571_c3_g1_i1:1704-2900(+)
MGLKGSFEKEKKKRRQKKKKKKKMSTSDAAAPAPTVAELQEQLNEKDRKMQQWKTKMKGIIENERGELTQLREIKAANEARIASLLKELEETGNSDKTTENFARFKERTNVAMKLRSKELSALQTRYTNLEEEQTATRDSLEKTTAERKRTEEEISRLEDLASQASISVARQMEIHTSEMEMSRRVHESEKLTALSLQREQLQEVKDSYEAKILALHKMHEQEIAELSMKIDGMHAVSVSSAQDRVDELLKMNVELQNKLVAQEAETTDLKEELATKLSMNSSMSDSVHKNGGEVRELEQKVKRLLEENDHQAKRLWALQRELIEAKDAAGALREKPTTVDELSHAQQQSYLRGVLINFLTARTDDMKGNLMPLLATLLQLSPAELKSIYLVNPDWCL